MKELRRQAFHAILGVILVVLLKYNLIDLISLIIILFFGLLISYLSGIYKIPIIEWFLKNFDRDSKIKGKGVLTYFIGVILALILFEKNIAYASIMILALGDSFCHLGRFGNIRHPFNKLKNIEGLFISILIATIGAMLFVNFFKAFFGACISMILESFDLKIKNIRLDDNLLIPIISGIVITVL